MDASESECSGACVPGPVCSVRELAVASEWKRAADRISQGNSCCRQCLECVVQKAVQQQQWDCVVKLSQHCTVQQKSEVVRALTAHGQWSEVLQLIEPSVTSETVNAVVQHAVKEGQWVWIREVLKTGVCGQQVEWLCQQAVDRQQWDIVVQLVDMGVQCALRNTILQSALVQHHVPCTAKLIELGVSKPYREDGIGKEMAKGHGDFILQVVKTVQDPDLTDFVLQESMRQNQWQLVSELVKNKEGLCVTQLEKVCDNAVACKQWSVALQLLRDGVSPSNRIVEELFQSNMAQALVDLFPAGCLSDSLKGLLLMGSIRHGQGDFFVLLLQRESVSDAELMEAMMYAVHLLDKSTLIKIIRASLRCCQVFKQKFVHQNWKDNLPHSQSKWGEVRWLFDVFSEEGEKELALHVAASNTSETDLIGLFCRNEQYFDLKQRGYRYALRKLYEYDHDEYIEFVKVLYKKQETSPADRSFLFRQAVQFELYDLVQSFCEHGVSRKDLKFFVQRFFQTHKNRLIFSQICCKVGKNKDWLEQFAVRFAMREFFKQKTDMCLTDFIDLYVSSYDKAFTRQVFREAVGECVKFDCADSFVELCKKQFSTYSELMHDTAREDCIFAYTSAVTGNRPHFISKVCEEKIGGQCRSALNEFKVLIDIVFEKKAWNMLPGVSAGFKHLTPRGIHFQVLEYCVQKMLTDHASWPDVAPVLIQWLSKTDLGDMRKGVRSARQKFRQELWSTSLSRLKEWCVDRGHTNLAFLLALIRGDLQLIERLVNTQPALDLHPSVVNAGVKLAVSKGAFSTGATILKICPVNAESLYGIRRREKLKLTVACEDQGLVDWALTLNKYNWTYVREHHRQCQNPHVLNSIFQTSYYCKKWDINRELMTRCTDSEPVQGVFERVVVKGEVDLAEVLICRVNSLWFVNSDYTIIDNLLYKIITGRYKSDEVRLKMFRLCIASGLSTCERDVQFEKDKVTGKNSFLLLVALLRNQLDIVKLILASGGCSHERLHKFRKSGVVENRQSREEWNEEWKASYRCIEEAAATPSRLEHLARLVTSHSIGCQPGREERIQNLPVPELIRDMLRFRDVLSTDAEKSS